MENDNDVCSDLIFLTEIETVFENFLNGGQTKRNFVTLKERRRSQLHGHHISRLLRTDSGIDVSNSSKEPQSARSRWKHAFNKISTLHDPWRDFKMHKLAIESAKRHRYNPFNKTWVVDDILVKMQPDAFNRGAMRICFRLKRVIVQNSDLIYGISKELVRSSRNYVAKHYMEQVDREVYFQDVLLQMTAKVWGEEFNKHHPPKQVDILQMAILEFPNRPGNPLYHLEHYIDGEYIKYNSNSGFVDDSQRFTPQAFSHFTFERSGHNLIVVDIQGVGDLWTDPQIHTGNGLEFGDGNLGTRGMALFFHSHRCNPICEKLKLSSFDLALTECAQLPKQVSSKTEIRSHLDTVLGVSPKQYIEIMGKTSNCHSFDRLVSSIGESHNSESSSYLSNEDDQLFPRKFSDDSSFASRSVYSRFSSESDTSETITEEEDRQRFHEVAKRSSHPSCVNLDLDSPLIHFPHFNFNRDASSLFFNESILGQIHHDLANYHNCGRFVRRGEEDSPGVLQEKDQKNGSCSEAEGDGSLDNAPKSFFGIDSEAALFHEKISAKLGHKQAIVTLANLYLGLATDVLSNIHRPEVDERLGETYMLQAALARDRRAMTFVARAYVKGTPKLQQSYKEAVYWYKEVLKEMEVDDGGEFDSADPLYILKAELANLYCVGSSDLAQDFSSAGDYYTKAGDDATNAKKKKVPTAPLR